LPRRPLTEKQPDSVGLKEWLKLHEHTTSNFIRNPRSNLDQTLGLIRYEDKAQLIGHSTEMNYPAKVLSS
jgi:hypothetical protein